MKVYLIGIMESKSPPPLLPGYDIRERFCSAMYTRGGILSQFQEPGPSPPLFFFERITLCSPDGHELTRQATLAQNLQLSSCLYLPRTTILGSSSLSSLLPQVICYNDRKLALHPFIPPIKLHQCPYDESAQRRERHCLSLSVSHLLLKNFPTAT